MEPWRPDLNKERKERKASLSSQFIRPVYHNCLSDQFITPVYHTSLSDQFIRPVYHASSSFQFIRPVCQTIYQTSLSDQFIRSRALQARQPGPVPTPVARGCHGPTNTKLLAPVRGLRNLATMTVEQGGGGRTRTGTGAVEIAGRTAGPSRAGERGATTKILSR